eukprot:scaffold207249_cov22-Tisochrysis_lutea.AAC.1
MSRILFRTSLPTKLLSARTTASPSAAISVGSPSPQRDGAKCDPSCGANTTRRRRRGASSDKLRSAGASGALDVAGDVAAR